MHLFKYPVTLEIRKHNKFMKNKQLNARAINKPFSQVSRYQVKFAKPQNEITGGFKEAWEDISKLINRGGSFIRHLRAQVGSFDDKGIGVCRRESRLVSVENDELSGDQ